MFKETNFQIENLSDGKYAINVYVFIYLYVAHMQKNDELHGEKKMQKNVYWFLRSIRRKYIFSIIMMHIEINSVPTTYIYISSIPECYKLWKT